MTDRRLYYLATPYSDYPGGLDVAARDAAKVASLLIARGTNVFAPIVHGHALSIDGVDPRDQKFWLEFDALFMARCDALIIAKMTRWHLSNGVAGEIDFFLKAGKPIRSIAVHYAGDAIGAEIVALGALAG